MHLKKTYKELSDEYGVSVRTIQRKVNQVEVSNSTVCLCGSSGVLLLDTTYFGRSFGVLVIMESGTGDILCYKYVKQERIKDYLEGVEYLRSNGYHILGIVCDGLKGLIPALSQYPVQMCQFHQAAIGRRLLTLRPKLEAAIELKLIYKALCRSTKEEFLQLLDKWTQKWDSFIKERTADPLTGKSRYTHRKLRSSHLSLRRAMNHLFVYLDNPDINIPNTNNQIEGTFTALKNRMRNHNGLSKRNRKRFIDEFFKT